MECRSRSERAEPRGDAELLAALSSGGDDSRVAFRELYERHARWLLLRLSRRCLDRDLVDTALQDTFIAVWRKPSAYKGDGDVAAWMWGIAIRRLMDVTRRSPGRTLELTEDQAPASRRSAASAEEEVLSAIEYGDLGDALLRLPPNLQSVVRATVLDGLTTREASILLNIPHGTVKTRMHRAKAILRTSQAAVTRSGPGEKLRIRVNRSAGNERQESREQ